MKKQVRVGTWQRRLIGVCVAALCLPLGVLNVALPAHAADAPVTVRAVKIDGDSTVVEEGTVTLPLGAITDATAPTWGSAFFDHAMWVSDPIGTSVPKDILTAATPQRLLLSSLTADPEDDSRVVVTPSEDVSTDEQDRVTLSAPKESVSSHVLLVYRDEAEARWVKITLADDARVAGNGYDVAKGRALFARREGSNFYEAQLHVALPRRDQQPEVSVVVGGSGTTLETQVVDDVSTSESTAQVLRLAVNDTVKELKIGGRTVTSVNVSVGVADDSLDKDQPQYPAPAYRLPKYYDGTEEHVATGLPSNSTDSSTPDYVPVEDGVPVTPRSYGFFDASNSKSWKSGYRSMISFTVDAIPPRAADAGDQMEMYQEWLANITINGQQFPVTMPQLCLNPKGEYDNADYDFCTFNQGYGWATPGNKISYGNKQGYLCQRAWLLGLTTSIDYYNACGYWKNSSPTAKTGNGSVTVPGTTVTVPLPDGRVLFKQAVTSGPNAGSIIVVTLRNVRAGLDLGYSINDETMKADNGRLYWWHDDDTPRNANRWRSRYEVSVIGLRNPHTTVTLQWAHTSHNRYVLGASRGVTALDIPTSDPSVDDLVGRRGSISGWGHKDPPNKETPPDPDAWRRLCQTSLSKSLEEMTTILAPGTHDGCSYFWGELTHRKDNVLGFKVKNGYTFAARQNDVTFRYVDNPLKSTLDPVRVATSTTDPTTVCTPPEGSQTCTPEVAPPGRTGRFVTLPAPPDGEYAPHASSIKYRRMIARRIIPVFVEASLKEFTLRYADEDGTQLNADKLPDVAFDVESRSLVPVSARIPSLPPKEEGTYRVFSHWKLVAARADGTEICTIDPEVRPTDLLDLSDPRCGNTPALTAETGDLVADHLALEAVPATVDTPGSPSYYPVVRAYRAPGATEDTVIDGFEYSAVPGLDVTITDSWLNTPGLGTHTASGMRYTLSQDDSTLSRENLGVPVDSELTLRYFPEPRPVSVQTRWTINGTTYLEGAQPGQVSSSLTVNDEETTSGEWVDTVPADTAYTLTETVTRDSRFAGCTLDRVTVAKPGTSGATDAERWELPVPEADGDTWTVAGTVPNDVVAARVSAGAVVLSTADQRFEIPASFRSSDPELRLPDAVRSLTPGVTKASAGAAVSAPTPSSYTVFDSELEGTWTFDGWDVPVIEARTGAHFTGAWTFHAGTDTWSVTHHRWGLPPESVGLDISGLPALPAPSITKGTAPASSTPVVPAVTTVTSDHGTWTFDGWRRAGTTWVGDWKAPATVRVTYRNQVDDYADSLVDAGGRPTEVGRMFDEALPSETRVNVGAVVTPDLPSSLVVNVRGSEPGWKPGPSVWGTYVFAGWDREDVRAGASGVVFTAKWTWKPKWWTRAIQPTNESTTPVGGSASTPAPVTYELMIPREIDRAMKRALGTALYGEQASPGSEGKDVAWEAPDLSGVAIRDDVNHGTWVWASTQPTSVGGGDFPKKYRDDDPEDAPLKDDRNIHFASGELVNNSEDVIIKWRFVPDPVHVVTNELTCHSAVSMTKAIGVITGAFGTPGGDATQWDKTLTAGSTSWTSNTPTHRVPEAGTVKEDALDAARTLTLTEAARQGASPHHVHMGWSCTAGHVLATDAATQKVRLAAGLGEVLDCTVTNTAAQLTLLGHVKGTGTSAEDAAPTADGTTRSIPARTGHAIPSATPALLASARHLGSPAPTALTPGSGTTVTATPAAGSGLATLTATATDTHATEENTHLARPGVEYTLSAVTTGGFVLVGFERYTGEDPNAADILDESAWEPIGSGTTPSLTVMAGDHEVVRAVHEPLAVAVELPLTGGTGRDVYLLAGVAALVLALLTGSALRRRLGGDA